MKNDVEKLVCTVGYRDLSYNNIQYIYITRNRIQHLDSLAVTIGGIQDDLSREINGIFFFSFFRSQLIKINFPSYIYIHIHVYIYKIRGKNEL